MNEPKNRDSVTRRSLVAATGLAAAGLITHGNAQAGVSRLSGIAPPKGGRHVPPFRSMRDWLDAMEAWGLLVRFKDVDQDAWEATAIMYHLVDLYGSYGAPVVLYENLKIGGKWFKGQVVGNYQGHWHQEAILWGLEPDLVDPRNSYRTGLAHMVKLLQANGGDYPQIPPLVVPREKAPCKEVVIEGDAIDVTAFPFIQGNPGDAGRYINTASTFSYDPEWKQNFGTYRCQILGPRLIHLNSEPNQTGNAMFRRARERGEKSIRIALVLGQDPVTWLVSGSRVPISPKKPVDELAYVGGLRGAALEVVKADLSDLLIPAHCEMVIEGDIDLTEWVAEGPYHETYGYLGNRNTDRFRFTVMRITHRRNPLVMNSFTSIAGGFCKAPMDAYSDVLWKQRYPQINQIFYHDEAKGITFISIRKDRPRLGLEIAKAYSERSLIAKLVVVVDDDLDVMNQSEMLVALGSRWQPGTASEIYPSKPASFFEPSSPDGKTTSKIAIDATMQWPEEGGPAEFPALNRNLFDRSAASDVYAKVLAKWPDQLTRKPW
ncbi:MAG: UbiD family decarboxylase [Gammaproteobacteria bacterium]|nr:UbiD family decarboxylase [Gammaproteobacteria bacterium]